MQVEISIDDHAAQPKVVIVTSCVTPAVQALAKKLAQETPFILTGQRDDKFEILQPEEIVRIYTMDKKTIAETQNGSYTIKLRLYELEERLNVAQFVRISNSEMINLKKTKSFDVSFVGTVCVCMCNGAVTYASRRYVTKIKQLLGI
ncbi:MAG: LytTR family DNA-binding domain-containing protein [Oscillospiraceae bacterium]|nr:LytTR family DNA-binding domain-containing protein [Oscillospiraceae bacterium]